MSGIGKKIIIFTFVAFFSRKLYMYFRIYWRKQANEKSSLIRGYISQIRICINLGLKLSYGVMSNKSWNLYLHTINNRFMKERPSLWKVCNWFSDVQPLTTTWCLHDNNDKCNKSEKQKGRNKYNWFIISLAHVKTLKNDFTIWSGISSNGVDF